jgi:hypothetical protein
MKGVDASEGGSGGSEVPAVPAHQGLLSAPNNCIGIIATTLDLRSLFALAATCRPLWAVLNSAELLPRFIMAAVKHWTQRDLQRLLLGARQELGQSDRAYEDQVRQACKDVETRSMDVLRHAMESSGLPCGTRWRGPLSLIKYGCNIGSATCSICLRE